MTFLDCAVSRILVRVSLAVLVLLALAFPQRQASAETKYPNKAVRIVLPFAAGGVADITARVIAEKLGGKLGGRFYIENQPGAGGIAAARTVISSPPDGYTLALLSNGTAISVSLFKSLPYDPLRDFDPISSLGFFDFVFATNSGSEFKTLADFIVAAKANPGAGVVGVGTIRKHAGYSYLAGKRRCRLRRYLLECIVCSCRHAARDRENTQSGLAGNTRRGGRKK